MARFARRPRATNATIRGFFKKHQLVGSRFTSTGLKLTLGGHPGARSGVTLRLEKLRRKIGKFKQLRGVQRKTKIIVG